MQKTPFMILLLALPLLALGAACDEDDVAGLEAAQALTGAQGEGVERHLAHLREELDLSDEQVTQLRAIFEEKHAEFHALRESGDPVAHEELRELWAEARASVNEVLTDEQEARLTELHESRRHRGFRGPPDPERHLARLQEELGLTEAQVAELRTIFEEQHAKLDALEESAPEDRREAFRALREETHARLSQVLTEEQRARFEELKRSHDGHHRGS
ncbi:MAG TPA: hypothetical protein VJP59_02830 [Gemmatimonadota bacterium]|nr:hypothetical protein [Gemmatimonadota bacterium]